MRDTAPVERIFADLAAARDGMREAAHDRFGALIFPPPGGKGDPFPGGVVGTALPTGL